MHRCVSARFRGRELPNRFERDGLPNKATTRLQAALVAPYLSTEQLVALTAAVTGNVPTNTMHGTLGELPASGIVDRDTARAKSEDNEGSKRDDRWCPLDRVRQLFSDGQH